MGVVTEPYHGVGLTTDEYGESQSVEIDLSDQEVRDQENYDMMSLVWANQLGLYEKKGRNFYLTHEGLRVSQERQSMTPEEVRDTIRKAMQERTHLKVLTDELCEWTDRELQQNPVELESLSVQDIFGADKSEILGASTYSPVEGESPIAEPKVAFEVTTVTLPNASGEMATVTYPTLVGSKTHILPPKKRGRPRKENFITAPHKNDPDTGVSRSEQMAIGMRQSKKQ
ncbi:MAG: hypothetical protein ACKO7B_21155 [Flavobacteriales bacterium]